MAGRREERDRAVADLHALLLRAAHFELGAARAASTAAERDDLALQAADDALVAVLAKLDDFRGASRFTTWAYKFALLEAGVKARRRAWQGREVTLAAEDWPLFADPRPERARRSRTPSCCARSAPPMDSELTDHQREVFVALALNEVPIDVLAERRGTTRGALYKTLHDAAAPAPRRALDTTWERHERSQNELIARLLGPRGPRSPARSASSTSTSTSTPSSPAATPTRRSPAWRRTSRAARPAARTTRACASWCGEG